MWTKDYAVKCDTCGKFCRPVDDETPFGCADPENPEPYDPYHYCKGCIKELYKSWDKHFAEGDRSGYYLKSLAEVKAAKKYGLVWVDSGGVGTLGTKDFAESYQYITREEHNRLSNLPYWGYCKLCKAERKGGYCSNKKCGDSFQYERTVI